MTTNQDSSFKPLGALLDVLGGTFTPPSRIESIPPPENYGCEYCHDAGFISLPLETREDGKWTSRAIACPKCRPAPASVGLPPSLEGKSFADFDLKLNPPMALAVERVKGIVSGDNWCALLSGPPGLGKSLLAAAALRERFGYFWEWGALLRNIRELAFGDGGPHHAEEDVLRPWQEGKFLLVLDDVGAEKMTEWASGTLYSILNARYQAALPTIITTNNPTAIDDRVLSRFHQGTVICKGSDVRRRV